MVDSFIKLLNLNNGAEKFARVLIKTNQDCKEFYEKFLYKNKLIINDLYDFRNSKINISSVTLDKFLSMCHTIGIKEAFETTFLYHFSVHIIELVENMISEGKTSLEEIYMSFIENPYNKDFIRSITCVWQRVFIMLQLFMLSKRKEFKRSFLPCQNKK